MQNRNGVLIQKLKMAVRFAIFPAVFLGTLAIFAFGFYNRYNFLVNVNEQQERKIRSSQEAEDFRRKFDQGMEQEKKKSD